VESGATDRSRHRDGTRPLAFRALEKQRIAGIH
jgi:hypothetical protein